jgi:hypothetical protein
MRLCHFSRDLKYSFMDLIYSYMLGKFIKFIILKPYFVMYEHSETVISTNHTCRRVVTRVAAVVWLDKISPLLFE